MKKSAGQFLGCAICRTAAGGGMVAAVLLAGDCICGDLAMSLLDLGAVATGSAGLFGTLLAGSVDFAAILPSATEGFANTLAACGNADAFWCWGTDAGGDGMAAKCEGTGLTAACGTDRSGPGKVSCTGWGLVWVAVFVAMAGSRWAGFSLFADFFGIAG